MKFLDNSTGPEAAMAAIHRLINVFLRRAWTGQFTRRPCSHLDMINDVSQPRIRSAGNGETSSIR